VAGEIDHDRGIRRRGLHAVEEVADDATKVRLVEVAALHHLEPGARQGLPDKPGVVRRGRQLAGAVGALADHEPEPRLSLGGGGGGGHRSADEQRSGDDPEQHLFIPAALMAARCRRRLAVGSLRTKCGESMTASRRRA
jgi:hypothetical protein